MPGDPSPVAVVFAEGEVRDRIAAMVDDLEDSRPVVHEPRAIPGIDWAAMDVVVLDWGLSPDLRRAAVETARFAPDPPAILAVCEGVPATDPMAEGADHYLGFPVGEAEFGAALRVTRLQAQYDRDFDEVVRAIGDEDADVDPDEVARTMDRADETLSELSEHLSYVHIFRRLIDD